MAKNIFKALMVKESTHQKVVVKAKRMKMTVDMYINSILKK